jgi:H(+)-translocating pyrophosphatase
MEIEMVSNSSANAEKMRHVTNLFRTGLGVVAIAICATAAVSIPESLPYIGSVVFVCSSALIYVSWLAQNVLDADEGEAAMKNVSEPIREGAEGFLRTQYNAIAKMAVVVGIILFGIYLMRQPSEVDAIVKASSLSIALITLVAFFTGAIFSGISGYIGMWMAVRINLRTAAAAAKLNYPMAFHLAMRGGLVCGVLVVGLCILGLCALYTGIHAFFGASSAIAVKVPHFIVGYGFGASLVALFAQLGGGIYTKAADVGADMVGKVEASIPEDDPRNPAVIADLVGDNVGDCAGRGADLFESITGEIIGAMILGASLAEVAGIENVVAYMFFPLLVHAFDLVISSVAVMMLDTRPSKTGDLGFEDPLASLERGYLVALGQGVVVVTVLSRLLLNTHRAPQAWMHYMGCGIIGIVTSYLFVLFTKYYTDYKYAPVQRIAAASKTGHGTNVIAGIAVGMESTALPAITIGIAIVSSFWMGQTSGLTDTTGKPIGGLFGTAVATMGMLSTAVYVLAMDTFGPITDNAGGIVEMSNQSAAARSITDRLDAVGNVTKATTKGYSIGAAGLASFLLLRAFLDLVGDFTGKKLTHIDIAVPEVFVASLAGGALIYLFSGWSIAAVGKTAGDVVEEVRRQFRDNPGIMDHTSRPDYSRCVSIVTAAALREMVKPGLFAVCTPVAIGVIFRFIGKYTDQPLLGPECVGGMLMFATATGILVALFLNNAGGAFDNAKKYIEQGAHGGKRSFAHQAAVTGDTLGDPLKDTAGPSIHVLIKMLSTITLVTCPLFLN